MQQLVVVVVLVLSLVLTIVAFIRILKSRHECPSCGAIGTISYSTDRILPEASGRWGWAQDRWCRACGFMQSRTFWDDADKPTEWS